MTGEDIWYAANFIVQQYRDPELVAARRFDSVNEAQLPAAAAAWKMIFRAVSEMLRDEIRPGEYVH